MCRRLLRRATCVAGRAGACRSSGPTAAPHSRRHSAPSVSNQALQRVLASGARPGFQKVKNADAVAPKTPSSQPPAPAATTASTTGASIVDCSINQSVAIRAAIADAQTAWLPPAITALSVTPIKPATTALLKTHFNTTTAANIATILGNFRRILADVDDSSAIYECESWSALCRVGSAYTWCSNRTSHICSDVFDLFEPLITRTVIHETGHRLGLCGDTYCDLHEKDYKKMSPATAIANPDSYAAFAGELSGKYYC
jgi:hypothetical protein